jgi:hypothetical protein
VFPAFGSTNTIKHIQPILYVSGLVGLGKDGKKRKNKFIFPVSFSQPDPSKSLTADGLNNLKERR